MGLGLPAEGLVDRLNAPARKDFLKNCQSALKGNWPAISSYVDYSIIGKHSTNIGENPLKKGAIIIPVLKLRSVPSACASSVRTPTQQPQPKPLIVMIICYLVIRRGRK